MEKPTFTNLDGTMTADGKALIEWLESQFHEADIGNDMMAINSLSGDIKHYYVNVYKLNRMTGGNGGLTPEKWLYDYRNSIAMNAWRNYQFTVEQTIKKNQLEATTEKTAELERGLTELKEAMSTQVAKLNEENAALKSQLDDLKAGKRKRKVAEEEAETDAESEA